MLPSASSPDASPNVSARDAVTSRLLLALVFNGVLVTTCLYAAVRGGRPERIGAGINIAASGLTTALRLTNPNFYAPAELLIRKRGL